MKLNGFSCESSGIVILSIETLLEDMKPVVTEKDESEYRDESIIISVFGVFGLARLFSEE